MSKKTKEIYVILSYTGTMLCKTIKLFTKAEYCHVSIALDKDLNEMYSFGRLNPYNPFIGGFVHEHINSGTFKRFKKTKCLIYSINISEEQYDKLKKLIKEFEKNKNKYSFNIIGMFAAGFNIKYKKEKGFYCAEFVKHVIEHSKINLDLPDIIKPIDFKDNNYLKLVYEGRLNKYGVLC